MNAGAEAAAPPTRRHRLAGWLDDSASPMVVKELRQGVKSRAFGFSFMLMQGLMVFCVVLYSVAFSREADQTAFNAIFWIFLGSSLLFVTPLRALNALQQEIKGNTLELIFLSRLTAWRIVAGKWMALYAQNLLIATAAMPYLLLRYFLGGFDIFFDLNILFWVLLGSAALTAVGVCLSAFKGQAIRVIVGIVAVMVPYVLGVSFYGMAMGGRTPFSGPGLSAWAVVGTIVATALGVILALNWGAGRIAPPAENYALRKRVMVLALLALGLGIALAEDEKGYLVLVSLLIAFAGVDALLERPRYIPTLYAGFARRGPAGRLAALFLLPGWPGGVFFLAIAFALLFGAAAVVGTVFETEGLNLLVSLPGALLFPLAVVLLVRPDPKFLGASYFGVHLICFLVAVTGLSVQAVYSGRAPDLWLLSFLPPTAFFFSLVGEADGPAWAAISGTVTLASLFVLFARMRPHLARQKELLLRKGAAKATETTSGEAPA